VTDPREVRPPHDRALLEPWALDLLDRESEPDPAAREEIAKVVALLRGLPDPEPPERLVETILARASEPRSSRRVLGDALRRVRRIAPPAPIALAMAAGVAGLIAFAPTQIGLPSILGGIGGDPSLRTAAVTSEASVAGEGTQRTTAIGHRKIGVVRPQFVFAQTPTAIPQVRFDRPSLEEPFARGLDRQLNQLMMNPTLYAMRLERIAQRDQFIERLAERAAQRGDAPEIALRVRQSDHPLAPQLVDRLLQATLVADASPR